MTKLETLEILQTMRERIRKTYKKEEDPIIKERLRQYSMALGSSIYFLKLTMDPIDLL